MQKTGCASQGFSVTQKAKDGKAEALATVWRRRGVGDEPAFGGKEAKGRADGQRHRSRTVLYVFHSFPLSYSLITKKRHPGIVQRLFFIWASPPVADPHADSPTSNGTPDAQPPHRQQIFGGRGWGIEGRGGKPFFRRVPSLPPIYPNYGKSAPMVVIEKVPCVTPRIERS